MLKQKVATNQSLSNSVYGLPAPRRNALLVAAALAAMSAAHAAPEGGQVVAGQAAINRAGSTTRIDQSSQRAIIDWRSYSVGAGERVQYVQPNAQAATLNRVTGDQISVILGRIDANGQVILINPNGVSIGSGAQLNVGSLIMSTAGISNADFLAGKLAFNQPGKANAAIVNAGSITAAEGGLVALVAPHVRNDGLIQARLGKVALGAGDTFTIDLYGDALLNLAVSDAQAKTLTHAGQIAADGGTVVLATPMQAKGVLDNLINLSGAIRADSVGQQGGKIVLAGGNVNVNGALDARGLADAERAGVIRILGSTVFLSSSARINASGGAGGGTINVGGAYQGGGTLPRSQRTTVAAGAQLDASARVRGNGGEVVVWSDGATSFAGAIAARGGAQGGNGGRIEVSGKQTLAYSGSATAAAPRGLAGSLLLDPEYAVIDAAAAAAINGTLRTGTSVEVTSTTDIDVNSRIDGRGGVAGGGITLTAQRGINLNEFIITDRGAITLNALGGGITAAPNTGLYVTPTPVMTDSLRARAAGATGSGRATIQSTTVGEGGTPTPYGTAPITVSAAGDITLSKVSTGGAISVTSQRGSVSLTEAPDWNSSALAVRAANGIVVNSRVESQGSVLLDAGAGGFSGSPLSVFAGSDVTLNAASAISAAAVSSARGNIAISSGGAVALAFVRAPWSNQNLTVNAGGPIQLRGDLAGTVSLAATRGGIDMTFRDDRAPTHVDARVSGFARVRAVNVPLASRGVIGGGRFGVIYVSEATPQLHDREQPQSGHHSGTSTYTAPPAQLTEIVPTGRTTAPSAPDSGINIAPAVTAPTPAPVVAVVTPAPVTPVTATPSPAAPAAPAVTPTVSTPNAPPASSGSTAPSAPAVSTSPAAPSSPSAPSTGGTQVASGGPAGATPGTTQPATVPDNRPVAGGAVPPVDLGAPLAGLGMELAQIPGGDIARPQAQTNAASGASTVSFAGSSVRGEQAARAAGGNAASVSFAASALPFANGAAGNLLFVFSGGRGVAQSLDLGRGGSAGASGQALLEEQARSARPVRLAAAR